MGAQNLFCIYCGKQFRYDEAKPPKFCLYCGREVILPERENPEPAPAERPEQTVHTAQTDAELPDGALIEFEHGETAAPQSNAELYSTAGERIFIGWLPEGFSGSAKAEPSYQTPDYPVLLWAYAKNESGASYFCRKERIYCINKMAPGTDNPFRLFDDYLDENAAAVLGTDRLRLLKRIPAFPETERQIREILMKRRTQLESQSQGNLIQYVVQGEYGAEGGKLYEAELGGRKRYLLLHTGMIADEYGTYSPMLLQSQARTNQMLQNLRGMGRMPFFGMPNMAVQQGMLPIDTDPNVPFGSHRTDGLNTGTIVWLIPFLAGFQSDSLPSRAQIVDFYRFVNSLKLAPETEKQIAQLREQLMLRKMQDEQQAANIMSQMVQDQQRSFDRRSAIMRDLSDHRDAMFQQRLAADNAAFDRRSRLQHEAIMGVNTYTRTDGTEVEADVRFDRVFQRENDPTQLIGAPVTADVPFGWTELEKMK